MSATSDAQLKSVRWAACVAGLWAGVLLGIGLIGAPAAFATVLPATAGRAVGRMFAQEAYLSLALALLMCLLLRRRSQGETQPGAVFSVNLMLALGALFCTVAGYFGIQPTMAAARAGESAVSFGTLHLLSASFFALKAVLVTALAWRLTAR